MTTLGASLRRSRLIAATVVVASVTALPVAAATNKSSLGHRAGRGVVLDPERDCFEPVPESASFAGVSDNGQEIALELLALLDGIPRSRGAELISQAAETYAPLNVELTARFKTVRFPHDGYHETGTGKRVPTGDEQRLMKETIAAVGGKRPPRTDAVLLLTNKDIFATDSGERQYGIGGVAYCIGGVRYPEKAFAISEGESPWEDAVDDETLSGKIAAHEVGHVMGAHHHYGNCVEGNRKNDGGGPSLCTVMWPNPDLQADNFGTFEGLVVRGHAVDFASP